LSGPAGETLSYFVKQDWFKKLITEYAKSKVWEEWQKNKLSGIIKL